MAKIKGKDGVIMVGANAVAQVRSFNVNTTVDTTDGHVMGDDWKSPEDTFLDWSGSIECLVDAADTNGQQALTEGATVALSLRPAGTGNGLLERSGSALITGVDESIPHDGLVSISFSFTGKGALTKGTQT